MSVCVCVHVHVIHVGVCVFLQFHLYPGLFSCFTFSRRETKNCLFWYHLYLQYFEGKYEEIFNVCKTIWELEMQIWKRIFFPQVQWKVWFCFNMRSVAEITRTSVRLFTKRSYQGILSLMSCFFFLLLSSLLPCLCSQERMHLLPTSWA